MSIALVGVIVVLCILAAFVAGWVLGWNACENKEPCSCEAFWDDEKE